MPCAPGAIPRKMFPPPMTMASSTPLFATVTISSVIRNMVARLIPNASSPMRASPESFRRTRLYVLVVMEEIPENKRKFKWKTPAIGRECRRERAGMGGMALGVAGSRSDFSSEVFALLFDAFAYYIKSEAVHLGALFLEHLLNALLV